jgi:linoleoyl-CoA desaturase
MKFTKSNRNPFFEGLKVQVEEHFTRHNKTRYGNNAILWKGIVLVAVYAAAYGLILQPQRSPVLRLSAYITMGLSGVMIVFNLVHDASHHALSPNRRVNDTVRYLGDLVGINTYIWDIRHNIQHHSFTNVLGGDLIIENIPLLRLSPHQPYKKFHRYQLYYAPLLYMLYSFYWMFVIDFKLFFRKDICNLHNIKHPAREWVILVVTKSFYLFYMLVLPWLLTPLPFWAVLGYFMLMHCAAGLLLSTVAVLGHFVEGPAFPDAGDGLIHNSWSEHELEATIDFAPASRLVNLVTGGLNTHVAHHLFPQICHIHYYDVTRIIETYCRENEYAYKKESFVGGLYSHIRYLKRLSSPQS